MVILDGYLILLIQPIVKWLPKHFAHALTAQLLGHMQKFVVICFPWMELQENLISNEKMKNKKIINEMGYKWDVMIQVPHNTIQVVIQRSLYDTYDISVRL